MQQGLHHLQQQLLSTFFEEASEALGQFESGLLALESGAGEPSEIVNDVFRAAHSIKGGAGTFGLKDVAEIAHVAETVLDRIRSGQRSPTPEAISILLEGVDVLRSLISSAREGSVSDAVRVQAIHQKLSAQVLRESLAPAAMPKLAPASEQPTRRFAIEFTPLPQMLETGNDAVLLLKELSRIGQLAVHPNLLALPSLAELQPTRCHLAWSLELQGELTRTQIEDVFSWVDEDAHIEIKELSQENALGALQTNAAREPERVPEVPHERSEAVGSIRVAVSKVDLLMNMVGELVITQSMLGELDSDGPLDAQRIATLRDGLSQLARNTRALQESVMSLRSMPIGMVFAKLPRLVHDLSHQLGKQVELKFVGQSTELDKTVIEKLGDPLVHLVRNSLDHGIETPEQRRAAGKPEVGTLEVRGSHRGSEIVVEIVDDGRGLDLQKILARGRKIGLVRPDETPSDAELGELIFAPGFSTAGTVSDVSGRGVGMDVVQRNIKSLGGHIQVNSTPGHGTQVTLRLPLTLAIIDGQLVGLGEYAYVIPLLSILESVLVDPARVSRLEGRWEVYRLRDELLPMVELRRILGVPGVRSDSQQRLMVIVESDGERLGLLVDDLLAQQQVVVKSLETNYGHVDGLSGATILGDGRVALILDVFGLGRLIRKQRNSLMALPLVEAA
jgi:two-component system chemotaxis sensor kinase CheA